LNSNVNYLCAETTGDAQPDFVAKKGRTAGTMVEKLRAANMPVEMMVQRLLLLDEVHVKFPLTDAVLSALSG
jgi:hypothetical protein